MVNINDISIYVGVFAILVSVMLITLALYKYYFNKVIEDKNAIYKNILVLIIPVYTLLTFGILQICKINIAKNIIFISCIVLGVIMCIMHLLYKIKKQDKYEITIGIISLLFFPAFSIWLSKFKDIRSIYEQSLTKLFQGFNVVVLIFAGYFLYCIINKIVEMKKGKKITMEIYIKFLVLFILSFGVLFLILMSIDMSNIYIHSQFNNINIDTYNFNNKINPKNFMSLIELIINSMYFSVITFLTIGYGDIYPTSIISKIVVISEVIGMFYLMYVGFNLIANRNTDDN